MNRLNVRLFVAFSIVLVMSLVIMWVALLLVLRARPINTDSEMTDLAAVLVDVRGGVQLAPGQGGGRNNDGAVAEFRMRLISYLQEQAQTYGVRIMLIQDPDCVLWDSAGPFPRSLRGVITREQFIGSPRRRSDILFAGEFAADGDWFYVGQALFPADMPGGGINALLVTLQRQATDFCGSSRSERGFSLLVAEELPEQTLGTVLEDYGGRSLVLALIQAVLIGLMFAMVASFVIVRWVSRPLKAVAGGAAKIANGDYSARVSEQGPIEVRVVAAAFNEMAERVDLSRASQRDFLANVTHDLRTPLTSIQGFAQAIAEGVADAEGAQHAAGIIYNEAGRLNRLVNDLLDLARIQAGRMDMMRHAVELDRILEAIGQSLNIKANEKGVRLHVSIPDLPRIAGDGDRLAQVFTNLVDNAIKHTPDDGEVWLRASLSDNGVLVQVQDNGDGIPKADLPRIFERFYQVDKSRAKRAGAGLGLAIAHEIILAHAGRIWAESDAGQGTCFNVWLPQPAYDPRETVIAPRS